MHLYACRGALAKGSTISIVEGRNGEVGGVCEERDCATSRRGKENRASARGLQEDNANFKKMEFAATSREGSATNGCKEWDHSENAPGRGRDKKRIRKRRKCSRR